MGDLPVSLDGGEREHFLLPTPPHVVSTHHPLTIAVPKTASAHTLDGLVVTEQECIGAKRESVGKLVPLRYTACLIVPCPNC